jgi:hypothetical protein
MDKLKVYKNGQWSLEKAYHRTPEEQAKVYETKSFEFATMARPHQVGGKDEIENHDSTNLVTTDKGENMYHHIFKNKLGDTRHTLSRHKDPSKEGVAGTLVQTDAFSTGFRDGRPVSAGIKTKEKGKGYGKLLLESAINHHGEWHSGESLSPEGAALIDSVVRSGKYHHTPDTPESKEFHDQAIANRQKDKISRIIFRVKDGPKTPQTTTDKP